MTYREEKVTLIATAVIKGQNAKEERKKETIADKFVDNMEINIVALIDSTEQRNEEMWSTIVLETNKDDNKESETEIDTDDKERQEMRK